MREKQTNKKTGYEKKIHDTRATSTMQQCGIDALRLKMHLEQLQHPGRQSGASGVQRLMGKNVAVVRMESVACWEVKWLIKDHASPPPNKKTKTYSKTHCVKVKRDVTDESAISSLNLFHTHARCGERRRRGPMWLKTYSRCTLPGRGAPLLFMEAFILFFGWDTAPSARQWAMKWAVKKPTLR